jgi:hypothetical protein
VQSEAFLSQKSQRAVVASHGEHCWLSLFSKYLSGQFSTQVKSSGCLKVFEPGLQAEQVESELSVQIAQFMLHSSQITPFFQKFIGQI